MAKIQFENKVALNENANIPDVNKCKATDMNEIKSVVNENYDNLLIATKGNILWSNPNPNEAISEEKTIELANNNYDFLEIFYRHSTTKNYIYYQKIPKGYGSRLGSETIDGITYRNFDYVSDTQYKIGKISTSSSYTGTEKQVIPLQIIGLKYIS